MHFQLKSRSHLNDGSWRDEPEVHFICENFHQLLHQLRALSNTRLQTDPSVATVRYTVSGETRSPSEMNAQAITEHWSMTLHMSDNSKPLCESLVADFTSIRPKGPEHEEGSMS